jgi:glutaredoxin
VRIELYTRPRCPLCDDAKRLLEEARRGLHFELISHDITADLLLYQKYRYEVPVVVLDGEQVLSHAFSLPELEKRPTQGGTSVALPKPW